MASSAIVMKRAGSGSLAQKLLAINPPPGYVYGSAYSGLGDDSGNPNLATIDAGIVIFAVIEGVTVYDRNHPRGQSFGSWCADHGIAGEEYSHLSNAVQSATPPYLTACVPVFAPRCVLCSGPGGGLLMRGNALLCRVGHVWEIHRFTIPEIPPSIEAEVILTETKCCYGNCLSTYAERPSMRGSNEAGELVDNVPGGDEWSGTPWPEDKHRAVVVGTMTSVPGSWGSSRDWVEYILPTNEDGEAGAKFAGSLTVVGNLPDTNPDDARLSELDNVQYNLEDVASHDPTGGELIPAPTVGDPWRSGLYYRGGKLVMARLAFASGRNTTEGAPLPWSRLLKAGGFALNRQHWPGTPEMEDSPDAETTYPSEGGETKVATLAASPTALDTYALFWEDRGTSDITQAPLAEMRCTVKSGNGRASSNATTACIAFLIDAWDFGEVKINGADPHSDVTVEWTGTNQGIITIPLDSYWTKSGTNRWSADQTLNVVVRWHALGDFYPIVNSAFNDVTVPSMPDPRNIQFDEFRQWDFGWPSQN